ncbi:ligand-binding domain of nuclear hormone receptor domain-containing protein [Ditylenchus destructor]|nr:ligand-binding domain of nuclear hormone receptor domain-containing protein [Ditylenchus destructor]
MFECKFNEMCSGMNEINRCRACRFDRCVLLGMTPQTKQLSRSNKVAKFSDKVSKRRIGPMFEETIEDKLIQSLVYVERKVRQIRESSRWLSESVICRSIRELLESKHENVLAHADQHPKELKWPLTRPADIEEAHRLEWIKRRPHWLVLDMFLCIEMDPPMIGDVKRIIDTLKQISCRTMASLSRIQMTVEEFVLLKAIIYSHSAIHGLSVRGRVLLEKESIRYSKTLMKHLQSRMGAAPGAKKYAEIISFVNCLFHAAQQQREIHVYIGAVMRPTHCCPPYMETIMYA